MTILEDFERTFREECTPVLETERLCLRAPRIEDAKQVAALANDRRIAENTLRIPHPYTHADAQEWISAANTRPGEATFLILRDAIVIGACGFNLRDGPEPEIGYWIGAPYWGQGFATEAARALVDHAFHTSDYAALRGGARTNNAASRRVLEKCGFQWIGFGLYRFRAINTSAPCDRYRLERSIWESLRNWGAKRVASTL